jgi:hypothetical protein
MDIVGAYEPCTVANDTTGGLGLPACSPAVPSGGPCLLDASKGKGSVKAKVKNGDVDIKAKAKGIQNCEGESVCAFASFNATSDNCTVGADCTTVEFTDFPVTIGAGCVLIDKEKIKIKTTLNTQLPGAVNPADKVSITINGVKLGLPAGTAGVSGKILAGGLLIAN